MKKPTGGPAFARSLSGTAFAAQNGMSLRDYFAAAVLAQLHGHVSLSNYAKYAEVAYAQADAMLVEREKE